MTMDSVYTYTCNDMRSVMLPINEYDDDDENAGSSKQLGYQEIWQCVTGCVCYSHLM